MKLGTIADGTRDGTLVVVNRDNTHYREAEGIASTMQYAVDNWESVSPKLKKLYEELNNSPSSFGEVDFSKFQAPLPRAYEWVDGSAYINHIVLVRKARGAEPPETLRTDPLVYQGGSGIFLGPNDPITLADPDWGCDFESEISVILGDTPQGTTADKAEDYIRLVTITNDVSLRNLIPNELKKGFGFFNSKPASAFAPLAVTPDELGESWREGRVHLPLITHYNNEKFGDPDSGSEMHFSFWQLIEHITKTRSFTAGTVLGSGTVSNEDRARGSSCLAEKRMLEIIENGKADTPFMQWGDTIRIEMLDKSGQNIFGTIDQRVVKP